MGQSHFHYYMMADNMKNTKVLARVIRTPGQIFKVTCMALACCILNSSVSFAFETTKASALVLEKEQGISSSLPQTSPLARETKKASPCLAFLSRSYAPPKHRTRSGSRQGADTATVPVALGLFLGVRIALIPSQAPQKSQKLSQRIQIGPEIRGISSSGNSYALAVAAFRKCQKEEFLNAGYN